MTSACKLYQYEQNVECARRKLDHASSRITLTCSECSAELQTTSLVRCDFSRSEKFSVFVWGYCFILVTGQGGGLFNVDTRYPPPQPILAPVKHQARSEVTHDLHAYRYPTATRIGRDFCSPACKMTSVNAVFAVAIAATCIAQGLNYNKANEYLLPSCLYMFVLEVIIWFIYTVIVYPKLLSPLRHLPTAPVSCCLSLHSL